MQNRWPALLLVVLLTATACGGSGDDGSDTSGEESESSSSGASDVPAVVAEVNGEEISKEVFEEAFGAQQEAAAAQQQSGGQVPDEAALRDQVVQSLVNQELLTQEAAKRELEPSEEQVEKTLTEQAQQNGLESADAFVKALEEQGLAREDIDEQAARQTMIDLLVADESGPVSASEKEIKALYAQVKEQQAGAGNAGQKVPPLEKVRSELVSQVESQERSETAQALLDQLREDADITINL